LLHSWPGSSGTDFTTLTGIVPGQPFSITEVFHIVNDGIQCCHLAAAILTKPIGDPVSVPGPTVGAGLPGVLGLGFLAGIICADVASSPVRSGRWHHEDDRCHLD
jgi:hypothetical protein